MSSNKKIKLKGKVYNCRYGSGYNNHNYTTIYDDADGRYIGELEDTSWEHSNFMNKLKKLVTENV